MKVALIPARGGSERVPGKNIRLLAGHPLLSYRVAAARESGCFDGVYVSTDHAETATIAARYGASVIDRPAQFATSASPDYQWVRHALDWLVVNGSRPEAFAILRPTSPFVSGTGIRQGWELFAAHQPADSLRMIRLVRDHPGKVWLIQRTGVRMLPLLGFIAQVGDVAGTAWHSSPTQRLPAMWVQTGGLEWAWMRTIFDLQSIAGCAVVPFVVDEGTSESLDINTEADWKAAERAVAAGASLPWGFIYS